MGLFSYLFGSDNKRNIKKLEKIASKIEALSETYKSKTDEELKETTNILKDRLSRGETLNDILPDAYACVREASTRVIGQRHYHVQLLGGIALFQGRIAEMKTGEGKTLMETLPAYLQALDGKGVHIVTVNEYLSERDAEWMGRIFNFLGLTVGVNKTGMNPDEKRKAYLCDITYSTNNELGFDYLRDNMVTRKEDRVQRGFNFAIVDEVDSILIDEARTPLIISGRGMKSNDIYKSAAAFAKSLRAGDYVIDLKEKAVRLEEKGVAKAERYFGVKNLSDIENIELNHHINNALRARFIMKKDENYIVKDGEVIIVDEFTGRLMIGRKYSNGLHQAIEAKEGVEIRDENKTLATITFQNFFRLYHKLSGMTGTAKTEEIEFNKIYNLDVVQIPTNLPVIRIDEPDIIYSTERAKIKAIVEHIKKVHETGRPILVGTITIDKSELISKELKKEKIKHNVLNAKNHQQESEIIAQAGRLGAVTIATNMAGRGTDILLGGNPEFMAKHQMRELGYNDAELEYVHVLEDSGNEEIEQMKQKYRNFKKSFSEQTDKEKEQVKSLGGLHIVGTERHESRRIDNQLRGRAGRQGDPGSSVFFVSMEDELIKRFGGERMQAIVKFFKIDEDTPFQVKMLSRQIENAQKRIEGFNFSSRNQVLKYDDVLNQQREIIYGERNRVLDGANVHEEVVDMIQELVNKIVNDHIDQDKTYDEWDLDEINSALDGKVLPKDTNFVTENLVEELEAEELGDVVAKEVIKNYEQKVEEVKSLGINFEAIERDILLRVVDSLWMDHIDYMNILRNEIGLRGYGNHDPIIEYKREGFEMFENMVDKIREEVALFLIKVKIEVKVEIPKMSNVPKAQTPVEVSGNVTSAKTTKAVGRNDLCPCGSGKKYKHCCGK